MRTVAWITFYAGILIGAGYVVGAITRHRLSTTTLRTGRVEPSLVAGAIEGLVVIAWAWAVESSMDWVAPGSASFRDSSAVGFLSSQALTAWESAAIWAALAATIGLMFPVSLSGGPRIRHDLASTGALAVGLYLGWTLPLVVFAAAAAFFAAQVVRGRPSLSISIAIATLPMVEWGASILQVRAAWGFVHGPETALAVTAFAASVAARRGMTAALDRGPRHRDP